MSSQPFDVLYEQIAPHVKRCPTPSMDIEIRRAARQLCLQTGFRRAATSFPVLANTAYYPLLADNSDEEVLRIEAAQYLPTGSNCAQPLIPISPEQAIGVSGCGTNPQAYWLYVPSQIVLVPMPTGAAGNVMVQSILQPTLTATTLDASLLQQCDRAIVAGALWRLLTMNNTPWENPRLATAYAAEFRSLCARAQTDRETAFRPSNLVSDAPKY